MSKVVNSGKAIAVRAQLTVGAQTASLAPPVGPFLSQKGVDKKIVMDFCKSFNDSTKDFVRATPIPVILEVYKNGKFAVFIKSPPVSYLLKKALGLEKFSALPGRDSPIATLSAEQCRKIAQEKMQDLNAYSIEKAFSIIVGSAKSMGIRVEV
jgi:large subunit ribosomal protein L11